MNIKKVYPRIVELIGPAIGSGVTIEECRTVILREFNVSLGPFEVFEIWANNVEDLWEDHDD